MGNGFFTEEEYEELLERFVLDGRELLCGLSEDLLHLVNTAPEKELVHRMFRAFHTLKGNSGIMGFRGIAALTHAAEDLLHGVREGTHLIGPRERDALVTALSLTDALIDDIQNRFPDGQDPVAITASINTLKELAGTAPAAPSVSTTTEPVGPDLSARENICASAAAGSAVPAIPSRHPSPVFIPRIPTGLKILIVEDEFVSRTKLMELFSHYGECHGAASAQEAVEAFTRDPFYDIVCMDIIMPGVSGLEAVRTLRSIEHDMEIPHTQEASVIMVSAVEDPHTVVQSLYECGATSYMFKPVNPEKIRKELLKLNLGESRAARMSRAPLSGTRQSR